MKTKKKKKTFLYTDFAFVRDRRYAGLFWISLHFSFLFFVPSISIQCWETFSIFGITFDEHVNENMRARGTMSKQFSMGVC